MTKPPPSPTTSSNTPARRGLGLDPQSLKRAPSFQPGTAAEERTRRKEAIDHHQQAQFPKVLDHADASKDAPLASTSSRLVPGTYSNPVNPRDVRQERVESSIHLPSQPQPQPQLQPQSAQVMSASETMKSTVTPVNWAVTMSTTPVAPSTSSSSGLPASASSDGGPLAGFLPDQDHCPIRNPMCVVSLQARRSQGEIKYLHTVQNLFSVSEKENPSITLTNMGSLGVNTDQSIAVVPLPTTSTHVSSLAPQSVANEVAASSQISGTDDSNVAQSSLGENRRVFTRLKGREYYGRDEIHTNLRAQGRIPEGDVSQTLSNKVNATSSLSSMRTSTNATTSRVEGTNVQTAHSKAAESSGVPAAIASREHQASQPPTMGSSRSTHQTQGGMLWTGQASAARPSRLEASTLEATPVGTVATRTKVEPQTASSTNYPKQVASVESTRVKSRPSTNVSRSTLSTRPHSNHAPVLHSGTTVNAMPVTSSSTASSSISPSIASASIPTTAKANASIVKALVPKTSVHSVASSKSSSTSATKLSQTANPERIAQLVTSKESHLDGSTAQSSRNVATTQSKNKGSGRIVAKTERARSTAGEAFSGTISNVSRQGVEPSTSRLEKAGRTKKTDQAEITYYKFASSTPPSVQEDGRSSVTSSKSSTSISELQQVTHAPTRADLRVDASTSEGERARASSKDSSSRSSRTTRTSKDQTSKLDAPQKVEKAKPLAPFIAASIATVTKPAASEPHPGESSAVAASPAKTGEIADVSSVRSSGVSDASQVMEVPIARTPKGPSTPQRPMGGIWDDVMTPIAPFFAASVVSESSRPGSLAASDSVFQTDPSSFGRMKPLPSVPSNPSTIIAQIPKVSLVQTNSAMPTIVELPKAERAMVGGHWRQDSTDSEMSEFGVEVMEVDLNSAMSKESVKKVRAKKSNKSVRFMAFQNASDSTVSTSQSSFSLSHRPSSSSLGLQPATRVSRGIEVPVDSPPPYASITRVRSHDDPSADRKIRPTRSTPLLFQPLPREYWDTREQRLAFLDQVYGAVEDPDIPLEFRVRPQEDIQTILKRIQDDNRRWLSSREAKREARKPLNRLRSLVWKKKGDPNDPKSRAGPSNVTWAR